MYLVGIMLHIIFYSALPYMYIPMIVKVLVLRSGKVVNNVGLNCHSTLSIEHLNHHPSTPSLGKKVKQNVTIHFG